MKKTKKPADQLELFSVDVSWFHVFKELIRSKTWANMSPAAKALYPTIKAFSNQQDGRTFPSLDTLEEYSGLSRPSVTKALQELEQLGYIASDKKPGKKTLYKLIEKFEVHDSTGTPVATAAMDYLPALIKDLTLTLRNYVISGMEGEIASPQIRFDSLVINNPVFNVGCRIEHQTNFMPTKEDFKRMQEMIDSGNAQDNPEDKCKE